MCQIGFDGNKENRGQRETSGIDKTVRTQSNMSKFMPAFAFLCGLTVYAVFDIIPSVLKDSLIFA